MQNPTTKWSELSEDEDEKKHKTEPQPQLLARSNPQQQEPYRQKKPQMQTILGQEIEKLIEDHPGQEVILNIVKCHFDATELQVQTAFPDFNITEVHQYNPGSFSLKFLNKADAKEFVYASKEVKILERGFWVKFPIFHQKNEGAANKEIPNNERLNKKSYDAEPRKPRENYNRKNFQQEDDQGGMVANDEEEKPVGFFRSDQKYSQQQPQTRPKYQKPQQKQQQQAEEDEWQTVEPPSFHTKGKPQNKPQQNRRK